MKKLPEKTIERLSAYRRALLGLASDGLTHIYSHQLAQMQGITAVQVRRDLMLIGFSSQTRSGYEITVLVHHISLIIDAKEPQRVAFVGMGNLAQAINHYFTKRHSEQINIVAAYDNDSRKIGQSFFGVQCYDIADLEQSIIDLNIDILILTCPSEVAITLHDFIENSGIKGVLNFTGASLIFDRNVFVENYDILTLLEKVAYFSK